LIYDVKHDILKWIHKEYLGYDFSVWEITICRKSWLVYVHGCE